MTLPTYYTVEEIAERIKVSQRSVYEWLRSGRLRGVRAGQFWRVSEPDLIQFLESSGEIADTTNRQSKKRNARKTPKKTH
ncbi:MAG: helix-turn-helix domain-containing protein [Bryobacteraceae bacterium]|nr:helix-turn-helix domain-containing protein [Bryobacteraceae bacterium]